LKYLLFYMVWTFCLVGAINPAVADIRDGEPLSRLAVMKIVSSEAKRLSFPPEIALAVARVGSDFRPCAVGDTGGVGVMQLLPSIATGEFGLSQDELWHPKHNINAAIRYLKNLQARYGRMDIALSHYRGGSAVRRVNGQTKVMASTRSFVDTVLRQAREFSNSPLIASVDANGDNARPWFWRPAKKQPRRQYKSQPKGWPTVFDEEASKRRAKVRRWESVYD